MPDATPAATSSRAEAALLDRVAALAPDWAREAAALDPLAEVSRSALDQLRAADALVAPLPTALGGFGWGTEPGGALGLLALLRTIGRGDLSLGRIFEGHVNALRLVAQYGTAAQLRHAAEDAAAGRLFAIWATDGPDPVAMASATTLRGTKTFCSAAAQAARAVITVALPDGTSQLFLIPLTPGERVGEPGPDLHGMRGCGTAPVDFSGVETTAADRIGVPGDYLRQPVFSAGAWRAAAVAVGGLDALVAETTRQLVSRGRHASPHQQARIGQMLIAAETASLWAGRAARIGESPGEAADVVGYVNLARTAIERACLEAIQLAQRSLGLAAFARPNPAERLFRDLATYLRQPAPDEALVEAAAWFTKRDLPGRDARG